MNDSKLIQRLKTKTQSVFKELYYTYYKLVYYQAFLILKNKEDSEDVSQTTFIKFWNHVDDLKDDTKLNQYLSLIAKNTALDVYRQKKKRNTIADNTLIESIPSEKNTSYEVELTLHDCLNQEESQICILRINFSYSFQEIANELHLSIGVVQERYYQAIKKLKKYYKEAN